MPYGTPKVKDVFSDLNDAMEKLDSGCGHVSFIAEDETEKSEPTALCEVCRDEAHKYVEDARDEFERIVSALEEGQSTLETILRRR